MANEESVCQMGVALLRGRVGQRRIDAYAAQCRWYVRALEDYFRKWRAANTAWRLDLAFVLENTGSASATDIDVEVVFPAESLVMKQGEVNDQYTGLANLARPERPTPPPITNFPDTIFSNVSGLFDGLSFVPPLPPAPPPSGPQAWVSDNRVVHFNYPTLKAKEFWRSPVFAAFVPPTRSGGMELDCRVHAHELTGPIAGQLRIVFAEKGG